MFKKYVIILLLLVPIFIFSQEKKVLFLGNSYTFFNDLPSLLKSLADAGGLELLIDQNTPGGCTLSHPSNGHLYNQQSLEKIKADNWDYVVLQEQSQFPVIPYWKENYFFPGAKAMDSIIKENDTCSKTLFFMTWGRKYGGQQCNGGYCSVEFVDFNHMTDSLASSYLENADILNASVSPVGIAWKNAIALDEQIELFSPDESHPSLEGSYLAACTFYASIFHESPIGLDFYSTLDESTATFLQEVASNTVFNNLDHWNIDTASVSASFDFDIKDQTVGFTNYSINANAYKWYFGDGTTDTVKNPSHNYEEAGLYSVELVAYKTCDTSTFSQLVNIVIQSTEENLEQSKYISLYPNLAFDEITIQNHTLEGVFDISLIDKNGRTIIHEKKLFQPGNKVKIKVVDLDAAIYILRISNTDFGVTKKIYLN